MALRSSLVGSRHCAKRNTIVRRAVLRQDLNASGRFVLNTPAGGISSEGIQQLRPIVRTEVTGPGMEPGPDGEQIGNSPPRTSADRSPGQESFPWAAGGFTPTCQPTEGKPVRIGPLPNQCLRGAARMLHTRGDDVPRTRPRRDWPRCSEEGWRAVSGTASGLRCPPRRGRRESRASHSSSRSRLGHGCGSRRRR